MALKLTEVHRKLQFFSGRSELILFSLAEQFEGAAILNCQSAQAILPLVVYKQDVTSQKTKSTEGDYNKIHNDACFY